MNLISKVKKSAPAAATSMPAISNQPADDVCDLEALAAMLQQLQARNQQYQRAIDALIAARRIVSGWDPKPEPELVWSVRRDVLTSMVRDVDEGFIFEEMKRMFSQARRGC